MIGGIKVGYKNINGLMRHLRNNGISIAGSTQKRQLMNTGYFHGYKGYRFLEPQIIGYPLRRMRKYMQRSSMT